MKQDAISVGVPRSYANLSTLSIKTGAFNESVDFCLSGLQNGPDELLEILLCKNLAESYSSIRYFEKAEEYYLKAIGLTQTVHINHTKVISLYIGYADFLFNIERFRKSKQYYDLAIDKSRLYNWADSKVYASLLSRLGDY